MDTDPEECRTYSISERNRDIIQDLKDHDRREILRDVGLPLDLCDARADTDFVVSNEGNTPVKRLTYQAPDGTRYVDNWVPNEVEAALSGTDPADPDLDDDGLTDVQERIGLISVVRGVSDCSENPSLSTGALLGTSPIDWDTDGDGAVDGGGPIETDAYTLGETTEQAGEFYSLPTDPTQADVVHTMISTDASFRNRFDTEKFVQNRISAINEDYAENTNQEVYFLTVDESKWDYWQHEPSDSIYPALQDLENEYIGSIGGPFEDQYRLDLLIGFSHDQYPAGEIPSKYINARNSVSKPVIFMGTNDPFTTPTTIDRILLHETGHIFGANHPKWPHDDIPNGTQGAMCKQSCAYKYLTLESILSAEFAIDAMTGNTRNILTTDEFSELNLERMRSQKRYRGDSVTEYRQSFEAISR